MIAAALLLTLFNLWDEYRADRAAEQVLEQMTVLPENADTSEEQEIPDYLLNPDMEMPAFGRTYLRARPGNGKRSA